jgi:hypothetical protein
MLISFADTARVEQSFTNNRQQLRAALDAIRPSQRSTNISEALKLAAGLVNPGQSNEDSDDLKVAGSKLYIFSDGRFPAVDQFELGNLEPTFVPIGRSDAANVGIVAFGAGRSEDGGGRLQAYARLSNPGPTEADVLLRLFVNDRARPSDADRISIPAGETRSVAFDLPDFESGVLHLQAETGDRLGLDDEAWTIVGPPRRARVLVITPGNEPLEQALTTKAAAAMSDIRLESPEFLKSKTYQDQVDLGVWDLVVYDRTPPAKMPRTNTFFLGCLPPGGGWQARPEVALPQIIDAALSHRLMQWVDVNEIQKVISARPLVVPGGGTVLMDSDRGPLMAIAPREGFEDLVLGMSLVERRDGASYRNTDWPWRASFACLVYNLLVDRSGGQDSAGANDLRPGMPVTVEAPDARTGLDVQLPSGANVQLPPAAAGKAVFTASEELGVYRVLRGGNAAPSFAVNLLDAAETNIRPPEDPAIKIGYVEVAGKSGRIARPMDGFVVYLPWPRAGGIGLTDVQIKYWQVLVLLGLFIAAAEWIVYLRRVYV